MKHVLFDNVADLLHLNENSIKALHRLGIITLRDLLFYLPHSYQLKNITPDLSHLKNGELVQAEIIIEDIIVGRGRSPTKILASNDTGNILLVFFNKIPPFIFNKLYIKSRHIICGKVQIFDNFPQISHPEFILKKELETALEPIYSLTYALTNKQLYYYICKGFELIEFTLKDNESKIGRHLGPIIQELQILHLYRFNNPEHPSRHPELVSGANINKREILKQVQDDKMGVQNDKMGVQNDIDMIQDEINTNDIAHLWMTSRKKLAQHELTAHQASLKIIRSLRNEQKGHQYAKAKVLQQKILNNLNFELTSSQEQAIKEIEQGQADSKQMMRLLQGDVGSGKTLVALMTILNAISAGFQTALMAPTDLLANQHYEFFTKALAGENINIALLTGKTSAKDRKQIADKLTNGEIQILIGTHALFQENVSFKKLSYIIIDEQHKFGVEQRLKLINKALHPDILVMTATPIPRSLTLTMFGDMEVSTLKYKPKNRLPIITTTTSNSKIIDVINALERKIFKGEKIYWVCPLIELKEGSEANDLLKDVLTRFEILHTKYSGKVGLLHGKMKSEDKDLIMQQFKTGYIRILVATTVIEVGIDVPDACVIVIENAEQFGLAQLHQLRGRVGRGSLQSYCILVYNPKRFSAVARNRLDIMRRSNDGFYIAEQDMILRGSGEILGAKQSGEPQFFFANLGEDTEILLQANKVVNSLATDSLTDFQIKLFAKKYIDLEDIKKHNN